MAPTCLKALAAALIVIMCRGEYIQQIPAGKDPSDNLPSPHALWREQCSYIQTVYQVQPGETAEQLMTNTYPGMDWEPMWALVALCNPAVQHINPGPDGKTQIPTGSTLSLPVFQVPQLKPAAQQGAAGATDAGSNSSTGTPTSSSSSSGDRGAGICGCGPAIHISAAVDLLQIAVGSYPRVRPVSLVAALLAVCNPNAALTAGGQLQPGQQLVGVCTHFATSSSLQTALKCRQSVSTNADSAAAAAATAGTAPAAAASNRPDILQEDEESPQDLAMCYVTIITSSGPVRQVSVPDNCPWHAIDGCSGPSYLLAYQDVLTPCCNTHDNCYECSYTVGWLGTSMRQECDHKFLRNMMGACGASFAVRGWWDFGNKWNKFWCENTAGVMFAAVWAYQELKGGELQYTAVCPNNYGVALATADYCFYK